MGEFVGRIRALALALGAPGPVPRRVPRLVVPAAARDHRPAARLHGDAHIPPRCCCTSAMTVAGSVAGCLALHYLGRKGGEALVRKRFTGETIERAMAALQRNGVMAVLVPCAAAAAGAVQDLHPARRRRRHQRRASGDGDRDRPRRPLPRARHPRGPVRRARDGLHARARHRGVARRLSACWRSASRPISSGAKRGAGEAADKSFIMAEPMELSVVIPIRNEAASLVELHREFTETLTRLGPLLRDHRRRRWQHGRELRDPGAAAGGRSAAARDPLPPQLRADRGLRRRLRARARPADRHLRRRSAERSARHPGDGRAARGRLRHRLRLAQGPQGRVRLAAAAVDAGQRADLDGRPACTCTTTAAR